MIAPAHANSAPDTTLTSTPLAASDVRHAILHQLKVAQGVNANNATPAAWMRAAAALCREELGARWNESQQTDAKSGAKRVHYLSMEFLIGRALRNSLDALGLREALEAALNQHNAPLADILEHEPDAALGNGGLGRLAACFLDSMATLGLPSFGYGLRYQFGMFAQRIRDGLQVEEPDHWLQFGTPWEWPRPEIRYPVSLGGRVHAEGRGRNWQPAHTFMANAFDLVIPGHGTRRVATLRLWHASGQDLLDFAAFSRADYRAAAMPREHAEMINWVLYPDDSTHAGRELRLKQEYFLVSASLQDIIARHLREHGHLDNLGEKAAVHLNDTHPALAVPELMRLLIDERGLSWDAAWRQCERAFSYTNHTLMPEALETWPVRMLEDLLPRHLEIMYDINHHFLEEARMRRPGDEGLLQRISLIDESGERRMRMAPLSIVASHKVNGVSKLHSDLMVETIFADYAKLYPDRFLNVTNGVTPRRWVGQANRPLAQLLDARIGSGWLLDLDRLHDFAHFAHDAQTLEALHDAKRANKARLSDRLLRDHGVAVDPESLFDVQIKRIHEYKRQLLNLLHVVARYQAIIAAPDADWLPRTVIFAGKAASAYVAAKTVIRLIHDVARVVNNDPRVRGRLKMVFVPNYGVSIAEMVIPAADLSEQISTAGTEASGTGNMKFALNGALTIGTWDGANIEIAQAVGNENIFIFGLKADQVARMQSLGYEPRLYYEENAPLRAVLDAIAHGQFSPGEPDRYRALIDSLLHGDRYFLLADFASYAAAQHAADEVYRSRSHWNTKVVRNIAGMAEFSSDRTVRQYAHHIWSMPC